MAVIWCTTVSGRAAATASRTDGASSPFITTPSAPSCASRSSLAGLVVVAVTWWPCATSCGTSRRPRTPLARATNTRTAITFLASEPVETETRQQGGCDMANQARRATMAGACNDPGVSISEPQLPDPGLYGPDSMTWRIHGDPAMALAGFRSLLLQGVHPLVMAGFDANSLMRDDPWGRLRRTGDWVATVTYGTTQEAEQAGRVLRAVHASLQPGIEPETGRPYRVDDPELLLWVHCTEVESFLSTYRRCGGPLEPGGGHRFVG